MNLSDLPTVEVALKKRHDIESLLAKYASSETWILLGQEHFDVDYMAKVKADAVAELRRIDAEVSARITELGVNQSQ